MKSFLIPLLLTASLQAEHYLVLSGAAWHEEKESTEGRTYDTFIEGIGYQYRFPDETLEVSYTFLAINDSNGNFQASATLGVDYNVFWNVNLGGEAGLMSRQYLKGRKFKPVGVPKAEIDFGRVMLNVVYMPGAKTANWKVTQAVYVNVGIKF